MKLPKYAIENHQFTMIFMCLLVVFGIAALIQMPKSEDPTVSAVGSSVIVVYPGGAPNDIEELIVDPIESALNELDDIKTLTSVIENGIGKVDIEFRMGNDPDEKYSDVVQKVNMVRNDLPENITLLETVEWSISDVFITQLALMSDSASYKDMVDEAEVLEKQIEHIPGIKSAEIWAYPKEEVRIELDLYKLAQWKIPLDRVFMAIQDANMNIPGGEIDLGGKRLNVKTSGSYQDLEEIENTVIFTGQGRNVYLRDVATVRFRPEDETYKARFDGKRCIFIVANQKAGTNIFQIFNKLKPEIESFQSKLPPTMHLEYAFDQSKSVAKRVNSFFGNLFQGIVLVGLVIFAAVSMRASFIVMLAIPVSIMIGIGLVDMSGYGLQQMTIAGLVIALGLLVDNAIVVTDNTTRFIRMGMSRKEAAIQGTSQVGWAVVSATATTVLAFIPIIMIQDITGAFIRSMPLTVVYTLSASLLVSLTLTPYLSSKFLRIDQNIHERPMRRIFQKFIDTKYRSMLTGGLAHPGRTILIAAGAFVVAFCLMPLVGNSLFPKAEKPFFFVQVHCPPGSNLGETEKITRQVEDILHAQKEISHVTVNLGHGNPRIYYNLMTERYNSSYSHFLVEMDHFNRSDMDHLVKRLRKKFSTIPGARIEVKELEQGPPVEAPIAIRVHGNEIDQLKALAGMVKDRLSKMDGVVNINNPLEIQKTDLKIQINRDKAGMLGVPLSSIDKTIRTCITGVPITEFHDAEGKGYDIVVRLPLEGQPTLSDFDDIYISSLSGALVPLKQLASFELMPSPMMINHYDMDRSVTVTADLERGYSVSKVTKKLVKGLDQYNWPKGYGFNVGGESENQGEAFGSMGQALMVAIIAIFGVLVLQFRSYSQPFIVFAALPLALIGSVLALLLTGNTFSFAAFIGACSLSGIVVNNSIILVDYTNQLRREGKPLKEALQEAGETRFIPIVLTTMTTVGGLLPLTLIGGSLWAPMGWTIIGGLLTSTFLTLLIVPVLYSVFSKNLEM